MLLLVLLDPSFNAVTNKVSELQCKFATLKLKLFVSTSKSWPNPKLNY